MSSRFWPTNSRNDQLPFSLMFFFAIFGVNSRTNSQGEDCSFSKNMKTETEADNILDGKWLARLIRLPSSRWTAGFFTSALLPFKICVHERFDFEWLRRFDWPLEKRKCRGGRDHPRFWFYVGERKRERWRGRASKTDIRAEQHAPSFIIHIGFLTLVAGFNGQFELRPYFSSARSTCIHWFLGKPNPVFELVRKVKRSADAFLLFRGCFLLFLGGSFLLAALLRRSALLL